MPSHNRDHALPRRSVLVGGGAAVIAAALAACTNKKTPSKPTGSGAASSASASARPAGSAATASRAGPEPVDPAVIKAAVRRELNLLAAYDAAIAQVPAAAELLADFRAHHVAHLSRLDPDATPVEPGSGPAASASVSAATTRAMYAALAGREAEAARAGALACAKAGPTETATMLAEIAGNESQHSALLPRFPALVAP